jgi:hypothetical protein
MSNLRETVTVKNISKYGIFGLDDTGYYLSPKSGLKPDNFEQGNTYHVLVYTSGTGKKYINQIVGEDIKQSETKIILKELGNGVQVQEKAGDNKILDVRKSNDSFNKITEVIKKEVDWDKKQRQIQWQGILQAVIASPASPMFSTSKEEWVKFVKESTLEFVTFLQDNSK